MNTETQATATGHDPDCLCAPCLKADMDQAIRANGLDPARYAEDRRVPDTSERTRYARPGQRSGPGRVHPPSPAQCALVRRLLDERDTSALKLPAAVDPALLATPEQISRRGVSDLIDRLQALPKKDGYVRPATPGMVKFMRGIWTTRLQDVEPDPRQDVQDWDNPTFDEARAFIDRWKDHRPSHRNRDGEKVDYADQQGFYVKDGKAYRVRRSTRSGYFYALVWDDERKQFVYAAGAIRTLTRDDLATLEQAQAFGVETGVCGICGAELTNPDSVARGIGPVCAQRYA